MVRRMIPEEFQTFDHKSRLASRTVLQMAYQAATDFLLLIGFEIHHQTIGLHHSIDRRLHAPLPKFNYRVELA